MGKPSVQALPATAMACACVAGGALASIVLPAGCRLCEQLSIRPSRLPVCEECLAWFSPIRGNICRECGVPVDAVSGDDHEGTFFHQMNGGKRFVVFLPHVQAAKLTSAASYW